MDRGQFRQLSSSDDPADKFLVYTPNTLPYNPSAPLRNTVPYIPLKFTEKGVSIDPIIPDEYINPSVRRFLDNISSMLTPEQIAEQNLIREQLGLDHIRSELCHLGSVVEDDAISLSSDAEDMMKQFSAEFNISLPAGLPPRSLKEIYQLPHKGKGGDEDEEIGKKEKRDVPASDLNIGKLLGVESTRNLNDTEFMREIGWTDEAEMAAEYASQHIMYPFTK